MNTRFLTLIVFLIGALLLLPSPATIHSSRAGGEQIATTNLNPLLHEPKESLATSTINSLFVQTPPNVDGIISLGEWINPERIEFDQGYVTALNDNVRLYLLLNVLGDTINDPGVGDYFWLTFDVNRDQQITPNVDLNYGPHPTTGNIRYQYYLGPGTWTGLQPETRSSRAKGFGCFFADGSLTVTFTGSPPFFNYSCTAHRVWELGIDLAEIGAQPGDTIRMGLRIASQTPAFTTNIPPNFFNDFTNLIELSLAPPPAPLPTPLPGAGVQLQANAIEVTQAIQDRQNTMPLVADKRTVARVYARTTGFLVFVPQPAVIYLYGSQDGIDLPGSPLATLHTAPININRAQLHHTANFQLPSAWVKGSTQFRAVARTLPGAENASTPFSLNFTPKQAPTYWVVPINTGTALNPTLPSDAEIASQQSYLETTFPLSRVSWVRKPWQAVGATTSTGDTLIGELNNYYQTTLLSWFITVLFTGKQPFTLPDQIYGFRPSGGGLSDPTWWNSGLGRVSYGFRGTSREGTIAHEINHNLDRSTNGTWGRHVAGCSAGGPDPNWPYSNDNIQEVGFDTRLPWVATTAQVSVIPGTFPDFMSYCQSGTLPTKWISPYRWQNLFNNFPNALPAAALQSQIEELRQNIQMVYYVSGVVHVEGHGSLNPILVQPGIPTEDVKPGEFAIEILNEPRQLLLTHSFHAEFQDVEGDPMDTFHFNFLLRAHPETAVIRLKLGDQVLDEILVSYNPPSVVIQQPVDGTRWSGLETIQWTAADPDGDSLTFTILYSPDAGDSWFPVASGLEQTSYVVDTAILPGSEEGKIRVIASDGFHTVHDDSTGTFTVMGNPPQALILTPPDGEVFMTDTHITFVGDATDLEDSFLPEESFIWSVDGVNFGVGRQAEAMLPEGTHHVTLTVVDSDGMQDQASITIRVTRQPFPIYLPIIQAGQGNSN